VANALQRLLVSAARDKRRGGYLRPFYKRFVHLDGKRYVLHRFVSAHAAARLVWLLDQGSRHGVPLQTPVAWAQSPWEALKFGGFWVATDFLPGEALLGIGTPAQLSSLGAALARLHRIEGERPGALFRLEAPWRTWLQRLRIELARGLAVDASDSNGVHAQWLGARDAFLGQLERYQLIHGDLYGANIVVTGDAISFIDFELAAFEPAGLELAITLLRDFCGGRVALRMELLDAYLSNCSASVHAQWQAHCAFYLVAGALRLAHRRSLRARRLARRGRDGNYAHLEALRYAAWARRMVDAERIGAASAQDLLQRIE
jgi:Ser/Thr protein kinase RdoA (MazF antagonist)